MNGDARDLDLAQHVDGFVPRHLELRQRLAEHFAILRVVEGERVRGFAHADQLRGEQYGRVVGDAAPEGRVVAGRTDEQRAGLLELEAGELSGDVERRRELRIGARVLDEERLQTVARARGHEHPVRRMPVHHHRLDAVELVSRTAPGRAHAHAFDRVAVTRFVERDGAAFGPGRERREPVVETEGARGECRDDRRREVGAGEHGAAHLFLHDDAVDEAEAQPAERLGNEETRPAEVDDPAPEVGRDAGVVVLGHAPYVLLRRLRGEERADRVAQRVLLGREREVHTSTVVPT